MHIGFAVHGNTLIIRQFFAPFLLITVKCPIITVKAAPENCATVFIEVLLADNAGIVGFYIHDAYGVVAFFADCNDIPSDNVKQERFICACDYAATTSNITFCSNMCFVSAVILAKSPVAEKVVAVKKSIKTVDAVSHMTFSQIATMRIGKLSHKSS